MFRARRGGGGALILERPLAGDPRKAIVPWARMHLKTPFASKRKMKDVRVSVIHRLICPDIGALWIRMAGWEMLILFSLFFARELNLCKKKNGIEGRRAARVQIALPPIV